MPGFRVGAGALPPKSPNLRFVLLVSAFGALGTSSLVASEGIPFKLCQNDKFTHDCRISDVALEPCPEALRNKTCNLYRKSNVTFMFDFTPSFSAEKMFIRLYGVFPHREVLDEANHDLDACKYTNCPIVAGSKHTLRYFHYIKDEYPPNTYYTKWKLVDDLKTPEKVCCFYIQTEIV